MRFALALLATALVVTLTACDISGLVDGDNGQQQEPSQQEPSQQAGSENETPADDGQSPEAEGGDDTGETTAPREPLGSSTGKHPAASPIDLTPVPLRIDVTSLRRDGDVVQLGMSLTNEDEELGFTPWVFKDPALPSRAGGTDYDISGIKLIDHGSQKVYLPVLDSDNVCVCTNGLDIEIPPGESYELSATFGGIPEDVETVELHVPGFEPITDLPIRS